MYGRHFDQWQTRKIYRMENYSSGLRKPPYSAIWREHLPTPRKADIPSTGNFSPCHRIIFLARDWLGLFLRQHIIHILSPSTTRTRPWLGATSNSHIVAHQITRPTYTFQEHGECFGYPRPVLADNRPCHGCCFRLFRFNILSVCP